MNLLEQLKQLKNIAPDVEYSRTSKERLLSSRVNAWSFFMTNSRAAFVSVGLVAFALFAIIRYISPSDMAVKVDSRGLRAEAQAIDLQIKLNNLNFIPADDSLNTTASGISGTAQKTAPTSSPKDASVDDVLNMLSK